MLTILVFLLTLLFRLVLLLFSVRKVLRKDNLIQIYSKDQDVQLSFQEDPVLDNTIDLDLDFLKDLIDNISTQISLNIEQAFVNISPVPHSFTLNSIPIPFKQRIMLVLNSNMMQIFQKKEAEAQVFHELGHLSTIDNLIRIIFTSPRLFLQLAYWYFYIYITVGVLDALITFDIITALSRAVFLGIVMIIFRLSEIIAISFLKRSNRCLELLADWHMLQNSDLETSINALVKSGQRLEAIDAFYNEVIWLDSLYKDPFRKKAEQRSFWQWREQNKLPKKTFIRSILPIFPADMINEDLARKRASYYFLIWKLKEFRSVYYLNLEDRHIEKLAEDGQSILHKKRQTFLKSLPVDERPAWLDREETTFDWRSVDADKDSHLNTDEITELVKVLKEKPKLHLFENELETMAYERDHPTIAKRILFLWDNSPEKPPINE